MHILYDEIVKAGIPTDHHESDLYFPATRESRAILRNHPVARANATTFISQIDGKMWFDVPFAYRPYWDARKR